MHHRTEKIYWRNLSCGIWEIAYIYVDRQSNIAEHSNEICAVYSTSVLSVLWSLQSMHDIYSICTSTTPALLFMVLNSLLSFLLANSRLVYDVTFDWFQCSLFLIQLIYIKFESDHHEVHLYRLLNKDFYG